MTPAPKTQRLRKSDVTKVLAALAQQGQRATGVEICPNGVVRVLTDPGPQAPMLDDAFDQWWAKHGQKS